MKKISVVIPCCNEEDNVEPLARDVEAELKRIENYDYEIIFIDNASADSTREKLRQISCKNKKIKVIFNVRNFGGSNSRYYGICQASGDCVITMSADFQDPVELFPKLIEEWEKGNTVVTTVKTADKERKLMRFFRSIYYKLLKKISNVEIIEHFTGFGLYDKSFVEIMRNLKDPIPYLRCIVTEYASKISTVNYVHEKRRSGKSKWTFPVLYDAAMLSFTSYTTAGLRLASFFGYMTAFSSFLIALFYLIRKFIYWDKFQAGSAPILIGMFFLGGIQLIFLGFIGEYIISINRRVMNRPLVIEEERINFGEENNE